MSDSKKRKLAAILFADIVGYTALMHKDEHGAQRQIDKFNELFKSLVPKYEGQIIQFYGDACLCLFDSSVKALECATAIQSSFLVHPRVPVRMGLHTGDVYFDSDNVYGNSVNIASRIQSAGSPGSILFSERINNDIQNQVNYESVSLGSFQFKNVEKDIEVFALDYPGFTIPERKDDDAKLKKGQSSRVLIKYGGIALIALLILIGLAYSFDFFTTSSPDPIAKAAIENRRPSIAVLPFKDLSPQGDQTYFCEGVADEIIIYLSKVKELSVMASTSSFPLKGKSAQEVADLLGVDYIMDGSVKKEQNKAAISVSLINASTGSLEWAETFDRELNRIMEIQRDIATVISKKMEPAIPNLDKNIQVKTDNYEAFDLYLKGKYHALIREDSVATLYLKEALTLDPNFAEAWALYSWTQMKLGKKWNKVNVQDAHEEASRAIKKALLLQPNNSEIHLILGAIYLLLELDFVKAEQEFERAMGVNMWPEAPSTFCFCAYIHLLMSKTEYEKSLELLDKVNVFDPNYHKSYTDRAYIYMLQGKYEKALEFFIQADDEVLDTYLGLARLYTYYFMEYEKAFAILSEAKKGYGNHPYIKLHQAITHYRSGDVKKFQEIKEELESRYLAKEKLLAYSLAGLYSESGETKRALSLLEEAYKLRESGMIDIQIRPFFDKIRSEPRYKALLNKMGMN